MTGWILTSAKNSSHPINACKKVVFFGSSEFSIAALELLLSLSLESLTVITTPDRPQGRGLRLQPNPVKERCEEEKVFVLTPDSLRDVDLEKKVASIQPDLFVVSSYGKLIPASWLKIPKKLSLNLHPSLLPKYRGAAPIPWQILNGEKETGVSIAEVTKELDAGDIFHQIYIPLKEDETTESLTKKLSELSKRALRDTLTDIEKDALHRVPQDSSQTSYARKLTKEDGFLHFMESAMELSRKVRAFCPWPGTFVKYNEQMLRIVEVIEDPLSCSEAKPGTLLEIHSNGSLRIQTGKGSLLISKVQVSGRRLISGRDFANGERLKVGFIFESLSSNP